MFCPVEEVHNDHIKNVAIVRVGLKKISKMPEMRMKYIEAEGKHFLGLIRNSISSNFYIML